MYFEFCILHRNLFLKLLWLLWWIGTLGIYVCVKFYVYRPYCYFVIWGTVMMSGRSNFTLLLLFWELGFCDITFEF